MIFSFHWWVGDIFYVNWDEVLVGATTVVSTLGGFGSEEHIKIINNEANVVVVNAANAYGEPSAYLVEHEYADKLTCILPSFMLDYILDRASCIPFHNAIHNMLIVMFSDLYTST